MARPALAGPMADQPGVTPLGLVQRMLFKGVFKGCFIKDIF